MTFDICRDENTGVGPASAAFCSSAPPESFFPTFASALFPPLKLCQVAKFANGAFTFVSIPLDDATFNPCLAEHDAFTVGGTFPFFESFACGLPTP